MIADRLDALKMRCSLSISSIPLVTVALVKLAAVNVTPAADTADKLPAVNTILEVPPVTLLDVPQVPPPKSLKIVASTVEDTT